jgi:hypothetical protein
MGVSMKFPRAEQLYFEAPELQPSPKARPIAHSHAFRYRGHTVIVHLTGYAEAQLAPVWAMGVEVVKGAEVVVELQRDPEQSFVDIEQAGAAGMQWGKALVDDL